MFDPEQEEQRQEAERLNHFMVHTALSLEGTYVISDITDFQNQILLRNVEGFYLKIVIKK